MFVLVSGVQIKYKHGEVIPKEVTVLQGESVFLHCGSESSVLWTYGSEEVSNWERDHLFMQVYSPLVLENTQVYESGYYNCQGKMSDDYIFWARAHVKVEESVPIGEVLPSSVTVLEGYSAALICNSSKPVQWIASNFITWSKGDNKLNLHEVATTHSGKYLCRGVDDKGDIFHATSTVIYIKDLLKIPEKGIFTFDYYAPHDRISAHSIHSDFAFF